MSNEKQDQEVTISLSEIESIIGKIVKEMDFAKLPAILALKEEMNNASQKALFPGGDGKEFETVGKSIIDTSYFSKSYQQRFEANTDGHLMAERLRSSGGPFLRLSPIMEKFAQVVACNADPIKLMQKKIDLNDYNNEVLEQNQKIVGSMTTTNAGVLVPVEYLATIVEFATAQSQILPKVWRLPMGSLTMKLPTLVQAAGSYFGGIQLYHTEEALEKTDTKPSMDSLTLTAKKLIGLIYLTDELIADSSINIINYITGLFVRAFQYKTEGEILVGTGLLSQMLGITNDPGINLVARQTVGTVKFLDLINLESALDENFNNLTFISRRATVNTLRKETDTVGQPILHDGYTTYLGVPMPPRLGGHPLVLTRNVPALGTQGDIILGDLSFYIWGLRQDMTIEQSIHSRFEFDETGIRFVMRQDGLPGVPIAFAVLDNVPES